MNRALILGSCLSLMAFASCQKPAPTPPPSPSEEEIERRVQDRVTAELQKQKEAELSRREQALAQREQAISQREQTEKIPVQQAGEGDDYEPVEKLERVEDDTYEVFRQPLSSDGDWFTTPELGYVWRPRVAAAADWRPYTRGQWVYTDRGWTWVSEEPFGWATYHYGRWTVLRGVGWVWIPGREWAPAWVSWRSGEDYIGWTPLPPETDFDQWGSVREEPSLPYAFVTYEQFCEPSVVNNIVTVQQNVTIINKTKNITKIVRNRNTKIVINQGPKVTEVAGKTRRKIDPLTIEQQTEPGSRAKVEGKVLRVSQPVTPPDRKKTEAADPAKKPHGAPTSTLGGPEIPPTTQERNNRQGQRSTAPVREEPPKEPSGTPASEPRNTLQQTQKAQAEAIAQEQERQPKIRGEQRPGTQPNPNQHAGPKPDNPAAPPMTTPAQANPALLPAGSPQDAITREQERQRRHRETQMASPTDPSGNPGLGVSLADPRQKPTLPQNAEAAARRQQSENEQRSRREREAQERREHEKGDSQVQKPSTSSPEVGSKGTEDRKRRQQRD